MAGRITVILLNDFPTRAPFLQDVSIKSDPELGKSSEMEDFPAILGGVSH